MKKILYIIVATILFVACSKGEQDYPGGQTGTLVVNVKGFPVYDDTPTRAIGTADAGKTTWANGDMVFLKLQLKNDGTEQGSPLYYTLTYNGIQWNPNNPLPKVAWDNYSITADYTAYYTPAYQWNSSNGTLSLISGKVAGADEYLVKTTIGAVLAGGINIDFSGARNYSRLRVAVPATNTQIKLLSANLIPVNTTSPLGTNAITLTSDSKRNAYFYGTWAAGTTITIQNSSGGALFSKSGISAGTDGTSYAIDATFPAGENGNAAPRIYVEGTGDNARLLLTKRPTNPGAFFKFGSLVALNTTDNSYSSTTVVFNPTAATSFASWTSITTSAEAVLAPYHNLTNIRKGNGDPCRLVGYSVSEIKEMLSNDIVPDNGKWRLPTQSQNSNYIATGVSVWTTNSGVNGRYIGTTSTDGSAGEFLPFADYRGTEGSLSGTGEGVYLSSGYYFNDFIFVLLLSKTVTEGTNASAYKRTFGLSVRCVQQ